MEELTILRDKAAFNGAWTKERVLSNVIEEMRLNPNVNPITLKGVGESTRKLLEEYQKTGTIQEAELAKKDPELSAYRQFVKIIGVGPITAAKWSRAGYRSLADLRRAAASGILKLTNMQQLGITYYDDLSKRIPRNEVAELGAAIGAHILQIDPDAIYEIAGSYRRGLEDSGDVDIILTNKRHFVGDLITNLLLVLEKDKRYVASLSCGAERMSFLYRSRDGLVRQLDILNIAYEAYHAALLYFTGSWEFNVAMRNKAKKLGMRLNQRGLFASGKIVPTESEREIFALLDIPYLQPSERYSVKIE